MRMRILQFLASFAMAVIVTASLFAEETVGVDSSTSVRTYTETGPVKIIRTKGWPRWLVAVGNDTLLAILPIERCSTLTLLKQDSIYTFVYKGKQRKYNIDELISITQHGVTIYDSRVCPIHHRRMRAEKVPIKYGYLFHSSDDPPPYGYSCEFPYRHCPYIEGGCVVVFGQSPDSTEVLFCSGCDSAFAVWEGNQPVQQNPDH
jgi:hypothetical protein